VLEEVDLVRPDRRRLKPGERFTITIGGVSFMARL
jgi:hypothetical protein